MSKNYAFFIAGSLATLYLAFGMLVADVIRLFDKQMGKKPNYLFYAMRCIFWLPIYIYDVFLDVKEKVAK